MYTLAVQRDFIASHFLVGGDWGPENEKHSHHYRLEVLLEGDRLDQHGYLVDIVDVETHLEELIGCFRDQTLNELKEFEGLNPSIEHFSRILCQALIRSIKTDHLKALRVKIWENDIAWASFREEF
ncbi:MAG: 6-carboxytetrahydropterin synthase [Desulfobacterales bacterium]|nr:MAG: 6-carboxytetrahydropterin synthase [Desulfobacterales bacterium]